MTFLVPSDGGCEKKGLSFSGFFSCGQRGLAAFSKTFMPFLYIPPG